MSTRLLVVIPSHRRPDLLQRTLESLGKCQKPDEYGSTVVVENGGQFGAEPVVRNAAAWLNARYLYYPQGNKSAALNFVLEQLDDGLIVFFDDDVRFDPGVLVAYAEAARQHPSGMFFGGPMDADYEEPPAEYVRRQLPPSAQGWSWQEESPIVERPAFLGCNWAAERADLLACGGFDPAVGPGGTSGARGQETAMQERLLQRGLKGLYLPGAMVWHYVPKERCSKRWLYQRSFQTAMTLAYRQPIEGQRIAGIPQTIYTQTLKYYVKWLIALVIGNRPKALEFRRSYWFMRGWMHGYRYFTNRDDSPPDTDSVGGLEPCRPPEVH